MERVPGIDVSRWQGQIDWQRVKAGGYRYAFIRATIGDGYVDPRFYANWSAARQAGLLLSAYHVITPNTDAAKQTRRFLDVLDDRAADLPLVIDVERRDGMGAPAITACVRNCARLLQEATARPPIIYTARWYWNSNVLPDSGWRTYDLWVASYTSNPIIPRDWKTWRFWQYSERGRVAGVSSTFTDLNWFAGTYEDLLAYAGRTAADMASTPTGWRVQVIIPKLNVRSGPGLDYEDIGDLFEGDTLDVLSVAGEDVWVEFEPGRWAALSLEGEPFLAPVPCKDDAETEDGTDES
jgi:lysozyme